MLEVAGEEERGLLVVASDDAGSVAKLWVGDGNAVSWAREGCGLISERSLAMGDILSDGVSLVNILIRVLSEICGFFSTHDMSSGDRPFWA